MKTLISCFTRISNDSGRGRALFARAFGEDWIQHHTIFKRLSKAYLLKDEEKGDILRLTLRAGVLAFYDHETRSGFLPYLDLIKGFTSTYDSPTRHEENRKILASLMLDNTRPKESDDLSALKGPVEKIEILEPIAAAGDRDIESNLGILLNAVVGEAWYLHVKSSLTYAYNFAAVLAPCMLRYGQ